MNLDGTGQAHLKTGVPFFEHMLDQIARHGLVDLEIEADGDTHIDDHHTVEDVGIALGQALSKALGDKRGIRRWMRRCHAWSSIFPDGRGCSGRCRSPAR